MNTGHPTTTRIFSAFVKTAGIGVVILAARLYYKWWAARRLFVARNRHLNNNFFRDHGVLGALPQLVRNFSRILDFRVEQAKLYGVTHGRQSAVWDSESLLLSTQDPVILKYILQTNPDNYIKSDFLLGLLKPVLADGIFSVNHGPNARDGGKLWYFQRKIGAKMFTRRMFTGQLYETVSKNSFKVVELIKNAKGGRIDLKPICYKFTLDTIGSVGFGVSINSLDSLGQLDFESAFDKCVALTTRRNFLPFANYIGFIYPSIRELNRSIAVMDKFAFKVIKERLADQALSEKMDVLSHFIKNIRVEGDQCKIHFANEQEVMVFLRDVVMNFVIAGRDTTACTLTFLLYLLTQHPDAQERLYEEIVAQAPGHGAPLKDKDLKNRFPYLKAVVQEALRLFPPVPVNTKMAVNDDSLPDGTFLPGKTRVIYEIYLMGRSEKVYGKDANEFSPDRWIGANAVQPTEFEMPTFQPGKRVCLGQDLAKYELYVLTVELVRNFKFRLDRPVPEPPYLNGVTLSFNGGLPVIATRRS
mmetsp:Transcript_7514/g.12085  ORF Transcript_7514/g.12085 Transcript_7514/m.12085 type:complete len:529 (+) Transcript_7514:3191-4777(+)